MGVKSYTPAKHHELANVRAVRPESAFAHAPIDIGDQGDREFLNKLIGISRHSSAAAWDYYRAIGEVRYALARSQRIAGYARLEGVKVDPRGRAASKADKGVVADIVQSIDSRFGGTRGLVERFYILRMVPGEGYLIQVRDKADDEFFDGYWFMSPSEISTASLTDDPEGPDRPLIWNTARGRTSAGSTEFQRSVLRKDFLGRVWAPDGEYTNECDSPMQGIAPLCKQLLVLTESVMGRLESRLHMEGILLIPSEMNDAAIEASVHDGLYSKNKVLNYFVHVMTTNRLAMTSNESAKGHVPIVAQGPADVLDKLRWVIAEFTIQETDLKLRGELIGRILDGLYQSKQQTQGNEGASHFQSWTNGDEERRITVQPDLDVFSHAMTRMVLWPELQKRGWEPGKIYPWRIGYDLSDAQVKSNQGEDVRQGWDRNVFSDEYLRTISGGAQTDAPSGDEFIRHAGLAMGNPYLACWAIPEAAKVDWEIVAGFGSKTGPDPKSQGDDEKAGPGTGQPGSPADDKSDAPKSERSN